MTPSERDIVDAAMRWYRKWDRDLAKPPRLSDGWTGGEIALYAACKAHKRTPSQGKAKGRAG